jgi:hypothetical protein
MPGAAAHGGDRVDDVPDGCRFRPVWSWPSCRMIATSKRGWRSITAQLTR